MPSICPVDLAVVTEMAVFTLGAVRSRYEPMDPAVEAGELLLSINQ